MAGPDPSNGGEDGTPLTLVEERLQLALEAANALAWDWDVATGLCACIGNLHGLLGIPSDALSGTLDELSVWVHADDRATIIERLRQAARDQTVFEAEFRLVRQDGSCCWVKAKGRCHYGPAGNAQRMLGITIDISARRRAEEERRHWEHRFSEFFEALPQTCYFVTPTDHIADLNPAASRAWGYSKEELAGKPLSTIVAPEMHARMREMLEQWRSTGTLRDEEIVIVTKSGARRTVLVSAGVVRDANGRPVHSASVQVDITELRQAEREVMKLNEAIAHRDRVASMAEMAAALAHEVRQPLTALISNAEAAAQFLDTPEPDLGEARSALAEIIADGNRVNAVVKNLRGIFQKQAAPGCVLDVNQVVRDLGRLAQKQLVVRGTHLTLDLSPEPVPVLAEENLLQHVIVNLMNNALDAMEAQPAHTRSLAIRTTIAAATNAGVIQVVDSGPGVPADEIPKLFGHFHTTKRDGLGMGLCVCRNIVRSLGGRIGYEAGAGRGAVFRVEIPLSLNRGPA